MIKKKKQTAVKGASSALIISIAIHVILLFVAGAFVAVTVIQRSETKFEGKQIVRPKMKLKELQVPVKIEKQARRVPKLGQRMTANNIKMKSVDFKMPEVAGFGGGSSVNLSGSGFGGSLGFATTQINLFGLKSSGEKIVFILDSSSVMLLDKMGGVPAYTVIKKELTGLIGTLPPTALFNVIVCYDNAARSFSEELSPASNANVDKLKSWIGPLNADLQKIGLSTLPTPGYNVRFEPITPLYNGQPGWLAGVGYAVQKGADTIYWLGANAAIGPMDEELFRECERGLPLRYPSGRIPVEGGGLDFEDYGQERWDTLVAQAKAKQAADNKQRLDNGQPIRVLPKDRGGADVAIVQAYLPGSSMPRWKDVKTHESHAFTYEDVVDYINAINSKYETKGLHSASIGLKNKKMAPFNAVHFVPVDFVPGGPYVGVIGLLKGLTKETRGGYKQIQGMPAIRSSATSL